MQNPDKMLLTEKNASIAFLAAYSVAKKIMVIGLIYIVIHLGVVGLVVHNAMNAPTPQWNPTQGIDY